MAGHLQAAFTAVAGLADSRGLNSEPPSPRGAGRFFLLLCLAGFYLRPGLASSLSPFCLCTAPALCISAIGMSWFGALLLQPQVATKACVRAPPCSASVRAQHDREMGEKEMQRENSVLVLLMKRLGKNVWMRITG